MGCNYQTLCLSFPSRTPYVEKAEPLRFYTSCIRSVCNYAIPVFHASLPQYLIDDLSHDGKPILMADVGAGVLKPCRQKLGTSDRVEFI